MPSILAGKTSLSSTAGDTAGAACRALWRAWGERLPRARGYCIHVQPFAEPLSSELETAVGQINRAMEQLIRQCPGQYLWGYGRYKTPRKTAA